MASTDIIDVAGPVHIADHGGDGRLLILIHGLEGSHLNWIGVADDLSHHHRVIAPDLSGFGLTPPAERGSTVDANAELVVELARKFGDRPATLIGNSMGGLIAMVAADRDPDMVDRIVLVDAAMPPRRLTRMDREVFLKLAGPMVPGIGAGLIRLYRRTHTPEEHAKESLAFVTADPHGVDPTIERAQLEMTRLRRSMPWSIDSFIAAARSIATYTLNRTRFRDMVHRISRPVLLIHGTEDRLVPVEAARWLASERPDWDLSIWTDTGHVPMIEHPSRFTREVTAWLT